MSWWITLEEPIEPDAEGSRPPVEVALHFEGGTYAVSGTTEATVNVTYNYSRHFDFDSLHDRTGADTAPELWEAVARLPTGRVDDYWEQTEGNAGYVLSVLLAWAEQRPDGVWRVN